jgi:23S rRNA (cytidine1920-2'-O)/16S rRNA (cytidine1409-2'-O)-methyltransferase
MAGQVRVNGQVQTKAGMAVDTASEIMLTQTLPYVSRGGYKLAHALDTFALSPAGLFALDVGASTGGFTDVLLQRGARRVYAVDVGYGQFDWRLRQDERVVVLERTNIRTLEHLPPLAPGQPPPRARAACIDVSFISLRLVLPAVQRLIAPDAWIVALVKPQFEAGRHAVGKGGVVRDPATHRQVLHDVVGAATTCGLVVCGASRSPITGPAGNIEFLLWLQPGGQPGKQQGGLDIDLETILELSEL